MYPTWLYFKGVFEWAVNDYFLVNLVKFLTILVYIYDLGAQLMESFKGFEGLQLHI